MSTQPLTSAETRSPHRRISVAVGCLFFFQLITFLIGSSLVQQYLDGDASRNTLPVGVALEMCAGLAVVAIGLLMYQVLKVVHRQLALAYPVMRITEFAVSAVLALYLLTQLEAVPNRLLWVYIPTGIGGLILNYLSLRIQDHPAPHLGARPDRILATASHGAARFTGCGGRGTRSGSGHTGAGRSLRVPGPAALADHTRIPAARRWRLPKPSNSAGHGDHLICPPPRRRTDHCSVGRA
jgi:hypothetical protein